MKSLFDLSDVQCRALAVAGALRQFDETTRTDVVVLALRLAMLSPDEALQLLHNANNGTVTG